MTKNLQFSALAVLFAAFAANANCAPVDPAKSYIKATFKQFNVPVSGAFGKFEGDVKFDPKQPAAATAVLNVQTSSFDLGDAAYNKEVAGPDWFDSKKYPTAVFKMISVKPAGAAFVAQGEITIRGISKTVQFPVSIVQSNPQSRVFTGKAQVKRLEFGVGQGDWGDTALVADEVVIDFKMTVPVTK